MKTLHIFKKKVTIRHQTEIIEISSDFLLIVHKVNSRVTSETITLKKNVKINKGKQSYSLTPKAKKAIKGLEYKNWQYYSPEIFDEIKTKYMTDIVPNKFKLSAYEELKKHGKLDLKRILYFDYSSHLVYRFGQEAPVSGIFIFDYIGKLFGKIQ